MFNHGFPYTNFHDLNLDWIVKTVKVLFNKSVFSINNVEPDDDGNVTITGAELGAVSTVNNISPVDGNVTLTASDVSAVAVGQGVTKVNGISPDAQGNVLSGTIRSINGISPTSLPTPGSITLNASDVGALPSSIDPVETVNGISPDANGNVNVGTVKSVNGSAPDAQGNVNLPTVAGVTSVNGVGPDAQGNVDALPVYSLFSALPQLNNLADLIDYARTNTKKIFQTTLTNDPSVSPLSPADTEILDMATIEMFCLGSTGETICKYWNSTKKKYYLAIDTQPVNNVLNPKWIKIYDGTAQGYLLENVVTPAQDVTVNGRINISNGVAYFGAYGTVSAIKSATDVLFTLPSNIRPSVESFGVGVVTSGSETFGCRVATTGDFTMMWQGFIPSGGTFFISGSFPI